MKFKESPSIWNVNAYNNELMYRPMLPSNATYLLNCTSSTCVPLFSCLVHVGTKASYINSYYINTFIIDSFDKSPLGRIGVRYHEPRSVDNTPILIVRCPVNKKMAV
jgi:hypothetical protein